MKNSKDYEEKDEFLEQAEGMTNDQLLKGIYAALLRMEETLDETDKKVSTIKSVLCFFELLLLLSFIIGIVMIFVTVGR